MVLLGAAVLIKDSKFWETAKVLQAFTDNPQDAKQEQKLVHYRPLPQVHHGQQFMALNGVRQTLKYNKHSNINHCLHIM